MILWFSSNRVTSVKKANQTSDSLSTVMFILITLEGVCTIFSSDFTNPKCTH